VDAATAIPVALTVNGSPVRRLVEPRRSLADFLREDLELTGTHVGCEQGACGACSVRVDGALVRGCLMLAVQAEGCRVETIEGATATGELADLARAFAEENALQCGFCTPGMLLTAQEILRRRPGAEPSTIREELSGNYCRCTGYHAIVAAVARVARARAAAAARGPGGAGTIVAGGDA